MFELCGYDSSVDGLGVHRTKKTATPKTPEELAQAKALKEAEAAAKKQAALLIQPEAFDWKPWIVGGSIALIAGAGLLYLWRKG